MRKTKLFLGAKAANTPPRGISKASRVIFSVFTLLLLSVGNVWAEEVTWSFKTLQVTSGTQNGISWETGKTGSANATACNATNGLVLYGVSSGGGYFQTTSATSGYITNVEIVSTPKKNTPKYTIYCSLDGSDWTSIESDISAGTKTKTIEGAYTYLKIANTTAATAQLGVTSITITYETSGGGGGDQPTPSAEPESNSIDIDAAGGSGTINVTYSNFEVAVSAVQFYDQTGESEVDAPSWMTADTDEENNNIQYSVQANNGEARTAYLKVYALNDDSDELYSSLITISQAEYVAPFDGLKLTFDVSSNPGEWPTSNSTTTTNYTYTLNEVDYTFALNNVKCNTGYLMLTATAKLGLPAISGYKLVKVEAKNSGGCSTSTKVKVSSDENGENVVSGGSEQTWATQSSTYTYTLTGTEENTIYYLYVTNKNCQITELVLYYVEAEAAAVATPSISGEDNFLNSTEVSMTCATEGAAIYYTTTESAKTTPATSGDWAAYDSENKPSFSATTTVWAAAKKDAAWSTVAEKTFTKITPLTVAQALVEATGSGKYVTGTITSITEVNIGYKNATYVISDISAGVPQNEMIVYRGKYTGGTDFSSADQIHVGDVVVVSGSIAVHAEKNQMAQGNQIVTISAPAVAAPVFNPNGGGFMGETDVMITCATANSAIYYTLDGSAPSKSSTLYEGAIHLTETKTITAIAYVGDESSLVIAKTFTYTAPMSVAAALTALDSENPINNVAVAGIISTAPTANPSNGRLTYYISDDGTASDELEVYLGYGLNGASFSAKTDLQVGDEVTVFGNLKIFSGNSGDVKEFDAGNRLLAFNRPEVAVSSVELDQDAASIEVNETVTLHATILPDNASDKSITWSVQSGSEFASVADGVVTGVKAGEAVIRATSVADNTKYAECTVTVTAADPTKHVVTFDATVDQGESPLSKSNITLTSSNGVLNNGSEYRLYKSSTTTFECSAGNITKIEFTGVSGNPVSGFGDPEVGTLVTEGNDGVWTGNAASVSFVASGAQVRATEIKVTYKEDNRSAAGLAWSSEAVVLTVGGEFTAPTLTNPNNIAAGEITIASGNTALAVVNDGVVSLVENATGEATITATFNGNDNYKPATISYTITVNEAGLDNITFDATTDIAGTNELSIIKGGFTLEFTDGVMSNSSEYRLYKNQTMTLSSADYKIKKIEFTCTSGNPISGFADAEGLDKANNQWTGEANSVELTASNAQVRITKLKVFYIEDTRAGAGIAYETTEYDATINGAFTTPTLTNSHNLTVTYSSSDQNLAQVDENSGDVTIGTAEGTVTITATFAGNDTYKPGTASYTINIVDPTPVILVSPASANFGTVNQNAEVAAKTINVTLKNVANAIVTLAGEGASVFSIDPESLTESGTITVSVTNTAVEGTYEAIVTISDASQEENAAEPKVVNISMTVQNKTNRRWYMAYQPKVGMQVIIAGKANNSEDWKAMGAQNTNNRAAVANSVVEGVLEPAEGTETFTLISAGYVEEENEIIQLYAIKTSQGGYLYAASSSANQLKTQTSLSDNGKWKISINDDGVATIKAQGTSTRNWMQYNSSSSLFACYSGAQQNIYLYTNHKQSPSSSTSQSIADITGSDTEEASATKVYVPAGKTLAVAATDPAIPELVVEAKKNVSTQIMNPERITTPDFYLDYQLCDGALDADYWYCIAVPFNVDINMGIYKTDGTKLTNHVDYEVWGYDTEKRAETMSNGWTRLNGGMMQAGHAYLIGFNDGMDNMVRLKAAADWKDNLYNLDYLALTAASNGADALGKHSNWNALGNPTTQYKSLNSENVSNVQMFDNNAHTFSTFDLATSNFVMGRPFFIQYGSNIAIEDEKAGGEFRAPKRQSEKFYYEVQIARIGKKYFDNQIIVRASEDATNTYEQGHDVITMNDATSKKAALLWTKNYGDMRLAAEEAPFVDDRASYELGIYAPANGTYSISVAEAKDNADLYLTYNGSIIWNLSMSEYTNDFEKGNNDGYGLLLVKKAPQVITGIDNAEANEAGVQKVIINKHVYILRAEQMYDVTGKMVK